MDPRSTKKPTITLIQVHDDGVLGLVEAAGSTHPAHALNPDRLPVHLYGHLAHLLPVLLEQILHVVHNLEVGAAATSRRYRLLPGLAIKNPPKKTPKNPPKKTTKKIFFGVFFKFLIFYEKNTNFSL
jgi:hypothetical protein